MSKQIPNDRRLADDERAYLLMRGEDSRVRMQDERYPAEAEAEDLDEDAEDLDEGEEGEEGEEEEEEGDTYDQWTVAELTAEIDKRKASGAEISPSGTKKQNLIDALREDDEE